MSSIPLFPADIIHELIRQLSSPLWVPKPSDYEQGRPGSDNEDPNHEHREAQITLSACTLVCRTWHEIIQLYRWYTLALRFTSTSQETRETRSLEDILGWVQTNLAVQRHVRRLHLRMESPFGFHPKLVAYCCQPHTLRRLLVSFKDLRILEMVDVLIDVFALTSWDNYFFTDRRIQTFKKRAAEISDHAHNPRGAVGEGVDFLRGLDESERQCKWLECILWLIVIMTDRF